MTRQEGRKKEKVLNKLFAANERIFNALRDSVIRASKEVGLTACDLDYIAELCNEGKLSLDKDSNYAKTINGVIDSVLIVSTKQCEILKQNNLPFVMWNATIAQALKGLNTGVEIAYDRDVLNVKE